jgi:hypothetical protein
VEIAEKKSNLTLLFHNDIPDDGMMIRKFDADE